jgi:hypothetical protein
MKQTENKSMQELQAGLRAKAEQDIRFRNNLMINPFTTLENELGSRAAVNEFLKSLPGQTEGELSEDELEGVVGGSWLSAIKAFLFPPTRQVQFSDGTSGIAGGGGGV